MHAIILSIGDELVSGLTINTNAAWLSEQLGGMGVRTHGHVTVGDDVLAIVSAIRAAIADLRQLAGEGGDFTAGVLLISGGLGPTEDDVTRQGVADALGEALVEDPDAMVQIERWFARHQRPMSPSNRLQALRPHAATVLENAVGTAPGLRCVSGAVGMGRVELFVMPGVPREMKEMFSRSVRPAVEEALGGAGGMVTRVTKINTFGMGESVLGEKIKDLMGRGGAAIGEMAAGARLSVGTTVHDGIVSVRIYATGTKAEAEEMTGRIRAMVRERLGALVFGEGEETLERAVGGLLKETGKRVATAESCTGGILAGLLTNVAGSSAYFQRGWVTYADAAKVEELEVAAELMEQHGAVSEEVARAMAEGARRVAGADYGVGITGVAGPEGGTAEKPVGTVWIGLAGEGGETEAKRFVFPGDRGAVRLRASQMALAMLRWWMMEEGAGG